MSNTPIVIDDALIAATLRRAHSTLRRRTNHNFHRDAQDNPHRFLNAMLRGTYAAPHRHLRPPKSESFIVLQGEVVVFTFGDRGQITNQYPLGVEGRRGVEIPAGLWHSVVVLSEEAVCYEVKPGPWQPATDKEFAPWAPREGADGWQEYLAGLVRQARRPPSGARA